MRYFQAMKFRFGIQLNDPDRDKVVARCLRAEAAGFDVALLGDHIDDQWDPLVMLEHLAHVTTRIRLGTLVLNNDFHHPVLLARRIANLQDLSGGRIELGLGAGHTAQEYDTLGEEFRPPAERKARLRESVAEMQAWWEANNVTVPLLIAGSGDALLGHAAVHADIIGLAGLGRTLDDGHNHETRWAPEYLDAQVQLIREAAGDRSEHLELNALIQGVEITADRAGFAAGLAERVGCTVDEALSTPFLAFGTYSEIAAQLKAARERWGISYFAVRSVTEFAPVVQLLRNQ